MNPERPEPVGRRPVTRRLEIRGNLNWLRSLKRWVLRLAIRLEDCARTGNLSRLKALGLRFVAPFRSPQARVIARALYLVAWHPAPRRRQLVASSIRLAATNRSYLPSVRIATAMLAKPSISTAERGLLLVSFETQLAKLAALAQLNELEKHYAILFLPTWQPFYSEALFAFASRARRPFWIMPSSTADQALCDDLGPLCRPLSFQASSWVSHAAYPDAGISKSVDLLMLANFSSYKRHWRLFEAARSLPRSIRIVVAGRPCFGRTAASLLAEAEAFGAAEQIEIREDPSDSEVARLLASARLFCALSHKEGSYIAVAEALMADTAVVMYADAIVGSKEYIGSATGWLLDPDRALAPQLLDCLEWVHELRPRQWAKANISAEANGPRLDALMQREMVEAGEQWTVGLSRFYCRHFEFRYFDPSAEARLRSEYQMLASRFGVEVIRPR
jgi:glycosyltransferase involved in cell wall biosynthesis